jgi:hypothetical protein
MRRILAALVLVIAPLLPAAPTLPVQAQAVPGTLFSISPASGAQGSTVNVVIEAGGIQPPYSVVTGTGIQVTSDQLVLVDGFSNERLLETFVIAANAPLGPSSVSVVGSNGTTNSLWFEVTATPAPSRA